jgi:hypothetical protein
MSQDDARFLQLVAMFQMAALQQMGKMVNPVSGEVERDFEQSKSSIDLIEMLAAKTEGNLTTGEKEFLDKVLFELRMNYVDEVNRAEKEKAEGKGAESEKAEEEEKQAAAKEDTEPENGESDGEGRKAGEQPNRPE